jgi:hypothetical protein
VPARAEQASVAGAAADASPKATSNETPGMLNSL